MPLLEGHIAAVTGAGSGIGRAIALGFAQEGAKVAAIDVNAGSAAAAARDIRAAGGMAESFALDVVDRAACDAVAKTVSGKLSTVSVLANCAGIIRRNPFGSEPDAVAQDWREQMSVNLDGTFNVTQAFLPDLRKSKGRVVNIGSLQSFLHMRTPSSAGYTASKHGVLGLTRALAAELGKDGIRVNAIGPGLIETPLNEKMRNSAPEILQTFLSHIPMGYAGKPEHIVGPAVFLASDMSAYVTGTIMMVDGGYMTV